MLVGAVGGLVGFSLLSTMLGLAPVPGSRPYPPPSPQATVETRTELGVESTPEPSGNPVESDIEASPEPRVKHPSLIDDIISGRYKPYTPWMARQPEVVPTPEPSPCLGHWIWMPPDEGSLLRICCPECSAEDAKKSSDELYAAYEQRVKEAAARAKRAAEERRKSGRVDCVSQVNGHNVYTSCW